DVAGTQRSAFQIAELVEYRMIAGAGVMAVPGAVLLFAVRRTHARIYVEHDAFRRTATMDGIDPTAGEISKSRKVLFRSKPLRLEAAHLARRGRAIRSRFTADDRAHRGIMPQALGVVHVLVSRETAKYGLPKK